MYMFYYFKFKACFFLMLVAFFGFIVFEKFVCACDGEHIFKSCFSAITRTKFIPLVETSIKN